MCSWRYLVTYEKPANLVHNAPIALGTWWGLFREWREQRDYRDRGTEGQKIRSVICLKAKNLNENLSKFANRKPDGQAVGYPSPTVDSARVAAPLISRCALFALFFDRL